MSKNVKNRFEGQITGYLKDHPSQLFKTRDLYRKLELQHLEYPEFRSLLKQMAESGTILRHKGSRYSLPQFRRLAEGVLHVKTQGYGFLIRDDSDEDVFISQRNMGSAIHRDRVQVELWARAVGKSPEGRVVKILDREREKLVGQFFQSGSYQIVEPDEIKLAKDVFIPSGKEMDAKSGQKVVVEIEDWGDARRMPTGRIVHVLGFPHDPGVDVYSVIHHFGLPLDFPKEVEHESEQISGTIPNEEIARRLDLRKACVFTIDPDDAKDFDDAVSLRDLPNGNMELGVHIADVSYFVQTDSLLDREAYSRGTSVYLADRVIPMLPERLSNQLCSLRPDEDHLTFSVLIEIDDKGNIAGYQIKESIICSKYRMTYGEVQGVLDGNPDLTKKYKPIQKTLRRMEALSKTLLARWEAEGSINFDMLEPRIVMDEKGHPIALGRKDRYASHRLVEAFMLLANRLVSEWIQEMRETSEKKFPFVYRVHEKPSGKKLEQFIHFIKAMGVPFNIKTKITSTRMQQFLEEIKGSPQEAVIETIALRSMMKAVYSTDNIGHFGLGFKHYTHFTSPIRRYPDLVVHKLLKAYLASEKPPRFKQTLSEICQVATDREIAASEAERESIRAKQATFMEERIGESFDAIISGVTSFGFFAEITEFLVEGLVHVGELRDDYYVFDEVRFRLTGERTGKVYKLGDPVRIKVVRVLHEMRKIDFVLAEE